MTAETQPQPRAPRLPDDQPVRDRITGVLRFDGDRVQLGGPIQRDAHFARDANLVVVAGAGSGKTHALVWRMVALVRSGVPPEEVAAITFTRKAAGEMRARFFEALQEVRRLLTDRIARAQDDGAQDDGAALFAQEREHVEHALQHIDQVFIDTIHAFCGRLLRERPLEAGVAPGFATVEDRDERIMRRRFWQGYLRAKETDDPEALDRLVAMGVEPQDLYGFFGDLCELDDLDVRAPEHPRPDLEAATETVRTFVETYQRMRPRPRPLHRDECMWLLDEAEHFIEHHGLETDGDRAHLIGLFESALKADTRKSTENDERGKVTPRRWAEAGIDKGVPKELDDTALPELVQQTVRPTLQAWRAHLYPFVCRFAREAVEDYERHRYREGQLTFRDLLKGAARLLREHPDVRRFFQQRYRRLLVDEFQDTDPLQAEVLFLLTGENTEETAWHACRPAPGSLFIVGDGKQSIYRFRRADVQIFEQVCAVLERQGGEPPLRLTANFRSTAPVCAWCNDALSRHFGDASRLYQTTYEPLRAFRSKEAAPPVRVLDVPYVYRNKAEGIAEQEAEQIAAYIRAACRGAHAGPEDPFEGPARHGHFMVLTRLSKRLPVYARALEQAGIPYQVSGGKALGGSDELRALLRLLECLLRPDDPIAHLAFLRGPFCGLSSEAFYRFRQADGALAAPYAVPDGLPEPDARAFADGFGVLERLRGLLAETTLAAALEQVVEETGFVAWAARTTPGSSRAGNVLRLLALIRRHEAQGLTWPEVVEELQLLERGEVDGEEMTLEAGTPDAVRLMTVHQAKGLQSKVVFLADPYDANHKPTPRRHVGHDEAGPYAVVPATVPRGPYGTELVAQPWSWLHGPDEAPSDEDEARLHEAAEHDRLLYVAATRAEDLLVVSRYSKVPGAGFWHRLYPALEGVPPLPSAAAEPDPAEGPEASRHDWAALARERARRRAATQQPTYAFTSVTEVAKQHAPRPPSTPSHDATEPEADVDARRHAQLATTRGTIVHRLFEDALRHRHAPLTGEEEAGVVRALIDEELAARPEAHLDWPGQELEAWRQDVQAEALQALAGFRESVLWAEVLAASTVYVELPFAAADEAARTVTTGAIDLIYRHEGGWKIVDFKTDRVDTEERLQQQVHTYTPQVAAYAEHWTRLTGEAVAEAGLWFTQRGVYVRCEVAQPA